MTSPIWAGGGYDDVKLGGSLCVKNRDLSGSYPWNELPEIDLDWIIHKRTLC